MIRPPLLQGLSLAPTYRCNLGCSHCPVHRLDADMPLPLAQDAVRRWVAQGTGEMWLGFQGGEPLLCPELVLETSRLAAELCRSRDLAFRALLVTNGVDVSSELLTELGRLGFRLGISLDGRPEVQARSRGPDSVQAWDTLRRALDQPELEVYAVTTVTPLTAPHLADTVAGLVESGVPEIELSLDGGADWTVAQLEEFTREVRRACELVQQDGVTTLFQPLYQPPRPPGHGCSAAGRFVSVAPDGEVYGCSQLVPVRSARRSGDPNLGFQLFRLGRNDEIGSLAFDAARARLMGSGLACPQETRFGEIGPCAECEWRPFCRACVAFSLDRILPGERVPPGLCRLNQALWRGIREAGGPLSDGAGPVGTDSPPL